MDTAALPLPDAATAWNTPGFAAALKRELEAAGASRLPLQRALTASSAVHGEGVQAMFLGADERGGIIEARVGIFFSGIVTGCSCAGDPAADELHDEYCELAVAIDRATAQASIRLAPEA